MHCWGEMPLSRSESGKEKNANVEAACTSEEDMQIRGRWPPPPGLTDHRDCLWGGEGFAAGKTGQFVRMHGINDGGGISIHSWKNDSLFPPHSGRSLTHPPMRSKRSASSFGVQPATGEGGRRRPCRPCLRRDSCPRAGLLRC